MTRRRKAWIAAVVACAALLLIAWLAAPEPEPLPLRFWIRTDDKTEYVYAERGGDPLQDWRWGPGPPTSPKPVLVTVRWRGKSALGLARQFGVVPMTEGHVIGGILPPTSPDDPWRECLSTNRSWPEEAVPDPEFAGEWQEHGGPRDSPVRLVFASDGSTARAEHPGFRWRWGRVGDVVVFGIWRAEDDRWSMSGAMIVSEDGRSYRTALGATGWRSE